MLKGIDISNHNANVDLSLLDIQFMIAKASGGTCFNDEYFENNVQQAINLGLPFGFYHFGHDCGASTSGTDEANYFYGITKAYTHKGIPILDWERDSMSVQWVNEFVERYHELSGVWPWIYANPWRFNQGGVNQNCARWVAAYPNVYRPTLDYDPGEPPETDGLVACWQFASDGQVNGYDGNLDINHFYGDEEAWRKYAQGDGAVPEPTPGPAPEPTPEPVSVPPIRYRAYTQASGWLAEMQDLYDTGGSGDDFAGDGSPILYLAMDFPGWYQVCSEGSGWLPVVRAYNINDLENGCAGDGTPITGVRCYYETPDPNATGWKKIEYGVANIGEGFFSPMLDTTDTGGSGDDYAGNGGRIGKFYAHVI